MKKFWPPTSKSSGSPYFLWQHEWDKHGKVYNYYQQEFNWSDMQGTAGQLEYYQAGIDLYKTFPYFQKVDSSAFTPDELARDLGLKKENFHLLCSHRNGRPANNHLREIQLCFSKTGSGVERKDLKFINCPLHHHHLANRFRPDFCLPDAPPAVLVLGDGERDHGFHDCPYCIPQLQPTLQPDQVQASPESHQPRPEKTEGAEHKPVQDDLEHRGRDF